jgi:hypothetical protein
MIEIKQKQTATDIKPKIKFIKNNHNNSGSKVSPSSKKMTLLDVV